jgi:osmoprotectant transport system ATP-binding protein
MRALMLSPEVLCSTSRSERSIHSSGRRYRKDLKEIFARLKQTAVLVTHDMGRSGLPRERDRADERRSYRQRGTVVDLRDHPASEFVSEFINAQRSAAF